VADERANLTELIRAQLAERDVWEVASTHILCVELRDRLAALGVRATPDVSVALMAVAMLLAEKARSGVVTVATPLARSPSSASASSPTTTARVSRGGCLPAVRRRRRNSSDGEVGDSYDGPQRRRERRAGRADGRSVCPPAAWSLGFESQSHAFDSGRGHPCTYRGSSARRSWGPRGHPGRSADRTGPEERGCRSGSRA
jgi:hypothetical protein